MLGPQRPFDGANAVRKRRVHEDIVAQVRAMIENGQLAPGDKLPPERELAAIFAVSRHAVREAIRTLEERGILASRRGAGTFVARDDEDAVLDGLTSTLDRERHRIVEIFEFRRMIEPEIAALAAQTASDEAIEACAAILAQQRDQGSEGVDPTALDSAFHMALARATGNSVLVRVVENVVDILAESRSAAYQSATRFERSVEGHVALIAALRARDPLSARTVMEQHLRTIEETVFADTV